jgi:hypothetical protein
MFVFAKQILQEQKITDRGLRKWIAQQRFPRPDGNLNGRNFWRPEAYKQWQEDVLQGKYRRVSPLSRKPANRGTAASKVSSTTNLSGGIKP